MRYNQLIMSQRICLSMSLPIQYLGNLELCEGASIFDSVGCISYQNPFSCRNLPGCEPIRVELLMAVFDPNLRIKRCDAK